MNDSFKDYLQPTLIFHCDTNLEGPWEVSLLVVSGWNLPGTGFVPLVTPKHRVGKHFRFPVSRHRSVTEA